MPPFIWTALVIEPLSGENKICTDIVLPHGGKLDRLLYFVTGFFEISEDMVKIMLLFEFFFTQDSIV